MDLSQILDTRFALRSLLIQDEYHTSESSVPKEALTPEREPKIRELLSSIASQIVEDPNCILMDSYSVLERKKDWKSLVEKKVLEGGDILPIDARSRPGHKLLDHHMPHFWDVANYKGVSVRSLVTQANIEKALMTNILMHSTPLSLIHI